MWKCSTKVKCLFRGVGREDSSFAFSTLWLLDFQACRSRTLKFCPWKGHKKKKKGLSWLNQDLFSSSTNLFQCIFSPASNESIFPFPISTSTLQFLFIFHDFCFFFHTFILNIDISVMALTGCLKKEEKKKNKFKKKKKSYN